MKPNILRGELLRLLKDLYPNGMEEMGIIAVKRDYYKPDEIRASLAYLVDKEYVCRIETPHPYKEGEKIVGYKIAPRGIDLVEGNLSADPGITVT